MAKVRIELVEDFYETMSEWFNQHGWNPAPTINLLPEKVFVANNGVDDVYCCCLYETNGGFAVIAYPLSNKEVKKNIKDLEDIFLAISDYADKSNIEMLFTTSNTEVVENALIDTGFSLGDTQVNQYIKWVKQ